MLWLFGLFLSAGFNLNMLYVSSLFSMNKDWLGNTFSQMVSAQPLLLGTGSAITAIVIFVLSNWAKTFFITEAHRFVHPGKHIQCPLCAGQQQQHTFIQRIPKGYSVLKVMTASVTTILLTVLFVMPLSQQVVHPLILSVTLLAIVLILISLSCWNIFTAFFIVLHGHKFTAAAKLALDLIVMRSREVFEFIFLLLVVYGISTVVGSVLIALSKNSLAILYGPFAEWLQFPGAVTISIQIVALVSFWVWLAITNIFFNVCLLIFFTKLVTPIKDEAQLAPAILPEPVQ